jgi:hypothetical protein
MHLMPFDEDTIAYSKTQDSSAIAGLKTRIENEGFRLEYEKDHGYLRALLKELNIPVSSQMLVGSKTSFQRERISPQSPRSLYFNDDIYLGYIPGSPLIEIAAIDDKLGAVFYQLEQAPKPRLVRNDQCLECHASAKTMGVPGLLVRSFDTSVSGVVDLGSGVSLVNHRTPLGERWGGWFVTGKLGGQPHRGNSFNDGVQTVKVNRPEEIAELSSYLAKESDVVALMVHDHQVHMHNFITRLHYAATIALKQYGHLNYLRSQIDSFVKYLVFAEEAPLAAPVEGTSSFQADFAARGPKDKQGRSLREFDLRTRLFKYPCSYLIYSHAFDVMPVPLKERIFDGLQAALSTDNVDSFTHLDGGTRRALREILIDTKPDLAERWKRVRN